MTDKQWDECLRIRVIARAECELEADLADSLAHTPLQNVENLTDEQCVLLYAIYLTRLRQSGSFGAPRQSVDPTEYFYAHEDADQAKYLTKQRQNALGMLSQYTETGEPKSFWERKLAAVNKELDQLNQAETMSVHGIAMWKHLLATEIETSDETYQRARKIVADNGNDKTESPVSKSEGNRPPQGCGTDKPQPHQRLTIEELEQSTPPLDTKSVDWVAARAENTEKLGYPPKTLSTYRLPSKGGRKLSAYFGVDKDGRRWRRDPNKTETSTVYYFASDLKKHRKKC
tara:strand:+ start:20859 stop:21719 length:861 start_codon:yes stop_codon:yes gene_type:complete